MLAKWNQLLYEMGSGLKHDGEHWKKRACCWCNTGLWEANLGKEKNRLIYVEGY
jgi:hypothetical protein